MKWARRESLGEKWESNETDKKGGSVVKMIKERRNYKRINQDKCFG